MSEVTESGYKVTTTVVSQSPGKINMRITHEEFCDSAEEQAAKSTRIVSGAFVGIMGEMQKLADAVTNGDPLPYPKQDAA